MRQELTEPAERDIRDILRNTMQMFGPQQARTYARIIEHGIELISDDPDRPGSIDRAELAPGVRLLHLEIAAKRSGGAAHCLYYIKGRLSDDTTGVIVVRVLHERMEPRHRVIRTLKKMGKAKQGNQETPGQR
jgi:toxin ParE1/3/4